MSFLILIGIQVSVLVGVVLPEPYPLSKFFKFLYFSSNVYILFEPILGFWKKLLFFLKNCKYLFGKT